MEDEIALQFSAAAIAEQQRIARAKVEAEAEAPRHPGRRGVVTRSEIGTRVTWRCAKCKATGKFDRGVSYGEIKQ